MKKTVITILLVLPFVLIYFISFTGQILSKYTHIYVERIVVVDDKGNEYDEGDYIKINKGEEYNLNIKVFPELASNKKVTISNSDKYVCSVDPDTFKVTGLDYGSSKLIITSIDKHYVQFIININITDEDITDIVPSKTEVTITKGKTEYIDITILPSTAIQENRQLIWTSNDKNIVTVNSGIITGINTGTTTIIVQSKHKPEIYKEISVTVISEYGVGVFFDNASYDKIYAVNSSEFDLKSITIINLENVTFDDIWYELKNNPEDGAIDISKLSEGKIIFNKEKETVIISVHAYIDDVEYTDKIKIWYVQG